MKIDYILFLDDERTIEMVDRSSWPDLSILIARSTSEAIQILLTFGNPKYFSFDHDLGGTDTVMEFLKWLTYEYAPNRDFDIPEYVVHSANPVGKLNIISYMESWKRSLSL